MGAFLDSLMSFGKSDTGGQALKLASNLLGARGARKAVKQYNVPSAAEQQSAALYAALADPNHPLMQQFTQQAHDANMSNFLASLRGMQNADRRQGALGRASTFFGDPERRDEAMNFMMSRGMPALDAASRQEAISRITQAAQGINTNKASQEGRLQVGMQNKIDTRTTRAGIPQAIMDIFSQARMQPQQQMPHPSLMTTNGMGTSGGKYEPGTINWNISQ